MVDHTVKAYDKELDTLERRIAEMGGIAEKMVVDAMDALSQADMTLAHQRRGDRSAPRRAAARDRGAGDPHHRAPPADGGRPARNHRRDPRRRRSRTGRRPRQEHRQAFAEDRPRGARAARDHRPQAHERSGDRADEGRARRLRPARRRTRARGLGARRRTRRARGFGVSRPSDPHDGRPAQHLVLRASAVLLEEHRADRRSRHQYRRDGVLPRHRATLPAERPKGRHDYDTDATGAGTP